MSSRLKKFCLLVSVLDVKDVPTVRLESHLDVLCEGDGGVTVDGDFWSERGQ